MSMFRFRTSLGARDMVHVINRRGVLVRLARVGKLRGHCTHAWTAERSGGNAEGRHVLPGRFRMRACDRIESSDHGPRGDAMTPLHASA